MLKKPYTNIATKKKENLKKSFIEVFKKKGCNVSATCAELNISTKQYYQWINEKNNKGLKFREDVNRCLESLIDFAEGKLMELIQGEKQQDSKGNFYYTRLPCKDSIKFFLNAKAKARGYGNTNFIEATQKTIEVKKNESQNLYDDTFDKEHVLKIHEATIKMLKEED